MNTCLTVFAKNPMPNRVKTRLTPALSPEQAAALYTAFLTDWCETLMELPDVALVIAYTPPDAQPDLQALIGDDAIYIPQIGADLGARLTSATPLFPPVTIATFPSNCAIMNSPYSNFDNNRSVLTACTVSPARCIAERCACKNAKSSGVSTSYQSGRSPSDASTERIRAIVC